MNVILENSKKSIRLTPENKMGEGGEGAVYRHKNFAIKIYNDSYRNKIIQKKKIAELSRIGHPDIIRPLGLVYDTCYKPVGFYMSAVDNAIPLSTLTTKAYKKRCNVTQQDIFRIISRMRELIEEVHIAKCLLVDLNQNNFLVSTDLKRVYAIDVDSYQTPSFSATAIMSSVRDWNATKFTEESDWFSFAVLSFNILAGIHPFRGNHPSDKGKKGEEALKERMLAGVSILNKEVKYPKAAVSDLSVVPSNWMMWYLESFHEHKRNAPPIQSEKGKEKSKVRVSRKTTNIAKSNLKHDIFYELDPDDKIIKDYIFINTFNADSLLSSFSYKVFVCYGKEKDEIRVSITENCEFICKIYLSMDKILNNLFHIYEKDGRIYFVYLESNKYILENKFTILSYKPGDSKFEETPIKNEACEAVRMGNGVALIKDNHVFAIDLVDAINGKYTIARNNIKVSSIHKKFYGMIVNTYMNINSFLFFDLSKKGVLKPPQTLNIKELSDHLIIDAVYKSGVAIIQSFKDKIKYMHLVRINGTNYEIASGIVNLMKEKEINFAVNSKGVCLNVQSENKISVFTNALNTKSELLLDTKFKSINRIITLVDDDKQEKFAYLDKKQGKIITVTKEK